jgi:1-acyl-sn-glycerol-3-phosphate acyltransferase
MLRNRRNRADSLTVQTSMVPQNAYWLAAVRSAVFNLVFFISLPMLLLINLPALLRSQPPYYFAKFASKYAMWLVRVICGVEYKIIGSENVPQGACIFASKHQSAWDTIIFLALYPDSAYVLKSELTKIPVYGQFIKKYGMISIDRNRGRKALGDLRIQAQRVLEQRRKIIIFPEGSRTCPGAKTSYQKGILALYKDFDCPIVPVALNSGLYWGRRSWIKWPGVITLQFLPPMPPQLESDEFMEQLTQRIETASDRLLSS